MAQAITALSADGGIRPSTISGSIGKAMATMARAYAGVFGTRSGLVLALRYFWMLTLTAGVDGAGALDGAGSARLVGRRLAEQHAGLRLVLDRHCPALAAHEEWIRLRRLCRGPAPVPVRT